MSDWGQGSKNNDIGWGQGAVNNDISWGASHSESWSGDTDINGGVSYFVRPAGTTYGDGSGTSYDNAWSGFSSINWSLLYSQTLNICGTFNESLIVQSDNVTIVGNNSLGSGLIDGQSLIVSNIDINSYNNITINNLQSINATRESLMIQGTSANIVTNNCVFNSTGNQGIQHLNTVTATHNNPTCVGNADDGISLHDSAIVEVNGGTFENNAQGINIINNSVCYVYDADFINNTEDLNNGNASTLTASRCTLRNKIVADSSNKLELINCNVISGLTQVTSNGNLLVDGCKYMGTSYISSSRTDITKVNIFRSYFEVTSQTKVFLPSALSVANVEYCTFKVTGALNTYAIASLVAGASVSTINNCNFIGNSGAGRGIQAYTTFNVKNSIFTLLNLCTNPRGVTGIINLDYCNTYLNTTINSSSSGGIFTSINEITTNPLFTDIANLDFRLQAGSGSIGTGTTLTNAVGIESADWVSSIPSVVTKNQGTNWNRGAYVN